MMGDCTEHQVIRDLLLQILGELKVANEIELYNVPPLELLHEDVADIREYHKP